MRYEDDDEGDPSGWSSPEKVSSGAGSVDDDDAAAVGVALLLLLLLLCGEEWEFTSDLGENFRYEAALRGKPAESNRSITLLLSVSSESGRSGAVERTCARRFVSSTSFGLGGISLARKRL